MGHNKPVVLTSSIPDGLSKQLQDYTSRGYRLRGMMHVVPVKKHLTQQGTTYEYEYGMLVFKEGY